MGQPVQAPKIVDKLRPSRDERKNRWVLLHNGCQYLLPIVSRNKKITPRFTESGVVLESSDVDPELAHLIESYMDVFPSTTIEKDGDGNVIGAHVRMSEEALTNFFSLARRLLVTNYEYSTDELTGLLSVSGSELSKLVDTIFRHLFVI